MADTEEMENEDLTKMDAEDIEEIIKCRPNFIVRHSDQKAYKIGNNVAIYQEPLRSSPDNRIPVPIPRRAVSMVKGYMGKPGNITYSGDYYESTLREIFDANDEELQNANMLEDAATYGRAFELHWFDATTKQRQFALVPIDQAIPIYSQDLKPKLKLFGWYRIVDEEDGNNVYLLDLYDDSQFVQWTKTDNDQIGWKQVAKGLHGYKRVPVLEATINRDRRNLFDHVLPLVDLYDQIISQNLGNELQRYNQALLLLANTLDPLPDEHGLTMADKIRTFLALDNLDPSGSGDVRTKAAYLERNTNDSHIQNAADRVERLIYEMLGVPNPNDDTFATASGIAQAYKLLGFEYLCSDIESYFSRFLYDRIRLLANLGETLLDPVTGVNDVVIKFERNLPHNLLETAQIIAMLKGTVTEETLLSLLPRNIVPDPAAEAEAVQEELGSQSMTVDAAAPPPNQQAMDMSMMQDSTSMSNAGSQAMSTGNGN